MSDTPSVAATFLILTLIVGVIVGVCIYNIWSELRKRRK